MAAPPVAKFKIKGVEACVWAKEDPEKGTRYSITTQKSYWSKTEEKYVNTSSFFIDEACTLMQVLNMAVSWAAASQESSRSFHNDGRTFTSDEPEKKEPF